MQWKVKKHLYIAYTFESMVSYRPWSAEMKLTCVSFVALLV